MITNDKISACHLGFSYFNKIGPAKLQDLEKYFPDLSAAYAADASDLGKAGLSYKLSAEFINWRKSFNPGKIREDLDREKINFVTWHEAAYPPLLSEISSPPPILYFKGSLAEEAVNRLAVVGSREHSAYAAKIIAELLPEPILQGIMIVSGLALGVDSLAHRLALDYHGQTIAVLGSGLNSDCLYPDANRHLADEIIMSDGAILSEFPPPTPPYRQNFPQRNRIISGLAQATIVVEAKAKSGSLITARFALDQNREVAAVPGNIFSEFSIGTNRLIAAGAKIICRPEDILEIFQINQKQTKTTLSKIKESKTRPLGLTGGSVESLVYNILREAQERAEKISADEIIKKSQLDTATINSTLSILEIKGIAKNDESGYYLD